MTADTLNAIRSEIAFAGLGWIGLNRMRSLLKEDIIKPVSIVDIDPVTIGEASEIAPGIKVYNDFQELIDSRPEGIIIATPNALHAEQSISALRRGIAVFCQKPLARTARETMEVLSAAQDANRILGVDLSYRYTDGMQKIYNEYRHEIGEIFAVDLVFNNAYGPGKPWFYDPVLSGGGCLIDLGVHMLDLAMWMLGFPGIKYVTSSLFSRGKRIHDTSDVVEDFVSAQIETLPGASISLECSWNLHAGKEAEIMASFYGTRGALLFYNINGSFYDFEAALCTGTSRKIISSPPDYWTGRALVNWVRELQESREFRSSALEYYHTAELIDMIYGRRINTKPPLNEDILNNG